jgi:FtsP/CotA-like multicopper oxidase with cupredoxin domain
MAKEKPKDKEKVEKKGKGLSRRDMLKMGAMGAGASALTVITSRKGFATHGKAANLNSILNQVPPDPTLCSKPTDSPPTTPFVSELPIPPPAIPTILNPQPTLNSNTAAGEAPRCPHQDFIRFYPLAQYNMSAQPALHQFDPAIPSSYVWAWNGIYPGPTYLNLYGVPTCIRIANNLPETVTGFGINETTVHLHNGHTPSESDGFADDWFGTGLWKDNIYPNVLAGFTAGYGFEGPFPCIAEGDPLEAQRHYWYHDHRETYTSADNYRGLNGQYLMYDCLDPGIEGLPAPSLNLPGGYGVFDIPLNFTDKIFCADGTIYGVPGAQEAQPAGDKFIVNGAVQPYMNVLARKYRFRMLNSGPTRIWTFSLAYVNSSGTTITPSMVVTATDGNLLTSPVEVTSLPHYVAQRYDVVIDFSQFPVGSQVYLLNNQPQFVNGGTEPSPLPSGADFPIEDVVMMFNVTGTATDTSSLPDTLISGYPAQPTASGTMVWNFDLINGQFHINGLLFDPCTPQIQIPQNTAMLWTIQNFLPNSGWVHPVHIHFEEQRVLSRLDNNGNVLPPIGVESGRKDVNPIPPLNQCNLYLQFRDFIGKYLIHCHNMNHEDNYMMARWDIIPSGGSLPTCYTCGNEQSTAQNFFIPRDKLDPKEVVAGTHRSRQMLAEIRRENIIKKFANRANLKEVLS